MNILVITPIYYIEGRKNLFHDTNCVHYLLKYNSIENNILVIHEYHSPFKTIARYLKKSERNLLINGYSFNKDNININMVETPMLFHQKKIRNWQKKRMIKRIKQISEQNNFCPDIIVNHIPSLYGNYYIENLKYDCPKIAVLHYSDIRETKRNKSYVKQLNTNYYKTFARSKFIRDYFEEKGLQNISETILYSGVPIQKNNNKKEKNNSGKSLLYVGKIIKRKHIDLILKSLNQINDNTISLRIVGDGPELNNLKVLCKKLNLEKQVEFIKSVPREKVYELMGEADLFIMPSTQETLGLVYLEAMSQGCICIGTKGEGIDGIIENNKNGFLVTPNDLNEITKTIKYILKMEEKEKEEMQNLAKKTAYAFEEQEKGNEYINVLEQCIQEYKKENNYEKKL